MSCRTSHNRPIGRGGWVSGVGKRETFLFFCPLYVFIHFSASFCTERCNLDLAGDHAP